MDCSPPGSSARGIFQARVLEWGAIAFSVFKLEEYIYQFSKGENTHIGYKQWFQLAFDFSWARKVNLEINYKIPLSKNFKGAIFIKAVTLFRDSLGDQLINSIQRY